jgi:hypothetical protein
MASTIFFASLSYSAPGIAGSDPLNKIGRVPFTLWTESTASPSTIS